MATAFSEKEREIIKKDLKNAAREYLARYGVRRTTVDMLVEKAGISKGSFYNFYRQKEALFFEVMEEYQVSLVYGLEDKLKKEKTMDVDKLTQLIYELFQKVRESFLMNIIQNREVDYLFRKLPKKLIKDHHSLDHLLMKKILHHVKIKEGVNIEVIGTALRAIAISLMYSQEVGQENLDEMLGFLIKGIVIQVLEVEGEDG